MICQFEILHILTFADQFLLDQIAFYLVDITTKNIIGAWRYIMIWQLHSVQCAYRQHCDIGNNKKKA